MNCYDLNNIKKNLPGFSLSIDHCSLEKGKIYSVVGPNGSGKSTFLNVLSLLGAPEEGSFELQGEKVDFSDAHKILSYRRNIAYLLQNPYLFDTSVYDNVAYGLRIRRKDEKAIEHKVNDMLSMLSLLDKRKKNAYQLSGGEAQRVAIARTFVLDTNIILIDEPTASIDKKNTHIIENFILSKQKNDQKTIVVSTHSLDQAYRLSSQVIPIIDGQMQSIVYENIFSGVLKQGKNGVKIFEFDEISQIQVNCRNLGSATIAIDPKDIILSNNRLESSALNNVCGIINKIENSNGALRVTMDAGFVLCSLITERSFHQMHLNIGKKVWASFKANAIRIIQND